MTLQNLITETDYAALRGVSVRTIQRERALRTGPAFVKLGRKVFYRPAAIESWIIANEQAQPRAVKSHQK